MTLAGQGEGVEDPPRHSANCAWALAGWVVGCIFLPGTTLDIHGGATPPPRHVTRCHSLGTPLHPGIGATTPCPSYPRRDASPGRESRPGEPSRARSDGRLACRIPTPGQPEAVPTVPLGSRHLPYPAPGISFCRRLHLSLWRPSIPVPRMPRTWPQTPHLCFRKKPPAPRAPRRRRWPRLRPRLARRLHSTYPPRLRRLGRPWTASGPGRDRTACRRRLAVTRSAGSWARGPLAGSTRRMIPS